MKEHEKQKKKKKKHLTDLNDFIGGSSARRQTFVQNPNLTSGVHPDLLHDLPGLANDGADLRSVGQQPARDHSVANFSASGLGGDVENPVEDLEQRHLRRGDLTVGGGGGGADEDDAVGGVRRRVLDSDLGAGGLLERLDEHAGLADDGAHARRVTEETEGHVSRVGSGTVHVTVRVVRVGVWFGHGSGTLCFLLLLQRKLLLLLPITLLLFSRAAIKIIE